MTEIRKLEFPETSLVLLIGPSGSGKTTFAKTHFKPTESISSDYCRAMVCDDENSNEATKDAFELLHFIAAKRLAGGKLTVIDATNVQTESRKSLIRLAHEHHVIPVAIVFNMPLKLCQERNEQRTDRKISPRAIQKQMSDLRRSLRGLKKEGFRFIYRFNDFEETQKVEIRRAKLWVDKKAISGPFDIIGDIHGCFSELYELIKNLGYEIREKPSYQVSHPEGRKLVFLGDLVDRGPDIVNVLKLVMAACSQNSAYCVSGNHDKKLHRYLLGKKIQVKHGLQETLDQLEKEPPEFVKEVELFLDGLISHYVFDKGNLVVAHAGLKESLQGRASAKVREFALYGETTGEIDEYGLPVRYPWAEDYRGKAHVVYGHTPVPHAEWLNRTINIDTGCVFGGKLTALRYPEMEIQSVEANQVYFKPAKPIEAAAPGQKGHGREYADLLDIKDVLGKKILTTPWLPNITIQEEFSVAALEAVSRFAISPKWLIYLPPTMSPSETSMRENYLEYPAEAFQYFKVNGVKEVICQEKHMGSRAVMIICQSAEKARLRFQSDGEELGVVYTRTGRRFFNDAKLEKEFINRVHDALDQLNWWHEFNTTWFIFDCELMPWNFKAQQLLQEQYGAVGTAAENSLRQVNDLLRQMKEQGKEDPALTGLTERYNQYAQNTDRFIETYQRYCWPVQSIRDLKVAPFCLLATESKVHSDKPHEWHMRELAKLREVDPEIFLATKYTKVDLNDENSLAKGENFWLDLTANGGEGMVVKPQDYIVKGKKGILQPALKCRGPEYLRIIYGVNYNQADQLERLRQRSVNKKRSLAIKEFALGMEALNRFVDNKPLYQIHECTFGVLALESDPVDPRL